MSKVSVMSRIWWRFIPNCVLAGLFSRLVLGLLPTPRVFHSSTLSLCIFAAVIVGLALRRNWARVGATVLAVLSLYYWAIPGAFIGGMAALIAGGMEGTRPAIPSDTYLPIIGIVFTVGIGLLVNVPLIRILWSKEAGEEFGISRST